jgi:hypothetical protein
MVEDGSTIDAHVGQKSAKLSHSGKTGERRFSARLQTEERLLNSAKDYAFHSLNGLALARKQCA